MDPNADDVESEVGNDDHEPEPLNLDELLILAGEPRYGRSRRALIDLAARPPAETIPEAQAALQAASDPAAIVGAARFLRSHADAAAQGASAVRRRLTAEQGAAEQDPELRAGLAEALGWLAKKPADARTLSRLLLGSSDAAVQAGAARGLALNPGAIGVDLLLQAVRTLDDSKREQALAGFEWAARRGDVAPAVAEDLVRLGNHEVVVLRLFLFAPSPAWPALRELGEHLLRSTAPERRELGVELLVRARVRDRAVLIEALSDPDLRGAAADGLAHLGAFEAAEALIDLLDSSDPDAKRTGRRGLEAMFGVKLPPRRAAWERYLRGRRTR